MSIETKTETVDLKSLHDHLSEALNCAESETAKYHLREAKQKMVILEDESDGIEL